MRDDIMARLRDCTCVPHGELCRQAADEIERLREALRIEQEEFAACCIDRKETQRERDELQKWKDAHNTFWRERAERRDAMREGEKNR